jgi:hypothetical protein
LNFSIQFSQVVVLIFVFFFIEQRLRLSIENYLMDNINKKINSWHKEISRAISSTGKKKSISGKTKSTCGDNRLNMCFDELELFDLFLYVADNYWCT